MTSTSSSALLRASWVQIAQERGQSRRLVERMLGANPRPRGKNKSKRTGQKDSKETWRVTAVTVCLL